MTSIEIVNKRILEYFENKDIVPWILKWMDIEQRILPSDDDVIPVDRVKEYLNYQADFTRSVIKEGIEELGKGVMSGQLSTQASFVDITKKITDNSILMERIMGRSQKRGEIVEENFYAILVKDMPSEEVEYVAKQARSGDIIIKNDDGSPNIIIDTKNYSKNVPTSEVEKFRRDAMVQGSSGILISISTGICKKKDFSVEIEGGRVLIYISNNGLNTDKVKQAIQIIRDLHRVDFPNKDNVVLTKDSINKIRKQLDENLGTKRELIENLERALASAKRIKLESI